MKTSYLRAFFLGECDTKDLSRDLIGSVERTSVDCVAHYIDDDLEREFQVTTLMLAKIGEAFLEGELDSTMVQQIAFAMMASDYFDWDCNVPSGERIANVIGWWDSPEINYPITGQMVRKALHYLTSGENTFIRQDVTDSDEIHQNGRGR